jgi:outer membrane protein OmpA-like peptidoglycan-associated protein
MNSQFLNQRRLFCPLKLILMLSLLSISLAASATIDPGKNGFPIIQFLGDKKAGEFALVGASDDDGVGMGIVLKSYRAATGSIKLGRMWVETGELKVVGNRNGYAFAQISRPHSQLSQEMFPKFSGPMAGDRVVPAEVKFKKHVSILPTVEIKYNTLFEYPNGGPENYKFTEKGKNLLLEETKNFASSRVPMVIVEGHTGSKGSSELNQIESYERAKTVRRFLISRYKLDPKKVLAVGYGEAELKDKSRTAGHNKRNRRVIVKAIDLDTTLINK